MAKIIEAFEEPDNTWCIKLHGFKATVVSTANHFPDQACAERAASLMAQMVGFQDATIQVTPQA